MAMIYLGRINEAELAIKGSRLPASGARALDEAEHILQLAREEAEQIRRQAYEHGYAEGHAKGQDEVAAVLAGAHRQITQHLQDLEPALVDCIVHSARTLVGEQEPRGLVEQAVLQVREYLADSSGLAVRVAPASVGAAHQAVDNLVQNHGINFPLRIVADPGVDEGDCVVESALGRAELRQDQVFARLRAAVEKALASRNAS